MKKFKLWREKNYSTEGYLYIKTYNDYVDGVIGSDIKLSLRQKIQILFCKGISVFFVGSRLKK